MFYSAFHAAKKEEGSRNRPRVPGLVVGLGLAVKDWGTTQLLFGPEAALKIGSGWFPWLLDVQTRFKSIHAIYQGNMVAVLSLFRSQLFNNSISQYGFSITQSSARMSCTSCSPPMRLSMAAMNFSPRFSGWVGSSGFCTTHLEKVRRALVASSASLDCSLHR